ncbi:MAG: LPS export ABC transporter periplasmic protein LptC [Gammaproteobacteria bacterium]|nr:LPS export ABC transporter periplasmic protein LptC [Gammaproteobacteria bacterium]
MKLTTIILVLLSGIVAIAVGWVYQSRIQHTESRAELEIPLDIDYYLSGVTYRVMSKTGNLDYDLKSPYLVHYKHEDLSRIETPLMNIYRKDQHWHIQARVAELLHQSDTFNLIDNVIFERKGKNPITMNTALLSFDIDNDIVTGQNGVQVISDNARIDADSAIFNLDKNIYSMSKTIAVYTK